MSAEHPLVASPPVRTSIRAVWLAGLVYVVAAATHPGATGRHLAAAILTATMAAGWTLWLVAQHRQNLRLSIGAVVVLAASGGLLVGLHPIGVAVIGIAGMCAASLLDIVPAAAATAPGLVAAAIAVAATGHSATEIGSAATGAAAGLVVGLGRRQGLQRTRQEAELALAQARGEVEHERAEALAERNRIAREVHDVLAHTLSALSVQLEALGSLVDEGAAQDDVRAVANRAQRLVSEGLEETRRAVRVLRDEPVDAAEQVAELSDSADATFHLEGDPRPLPPAAGLALVRVAQEALTNARKHATGSAVCVTLRFEPTSVRLQVVNAAGGRPSLATTGGGYGLQGMRERLELVGGSLSAGPHEDGWRVHAEVPA